MADARYVITKSTPPKVGSILCLVKERHWHGEGYCRVGIR